MKRLLVLSTILMGILLVPGLASATYLSNLVSGGNCDGFTADVDVHFRQDTEYVDLSYEVNFMDEDDVLTMTVTGSMRLINSGVSDTTIRIAAGAVLEGNFHVSGFISLVAPYDGGVDEEYLAFEDSIGCEFVANEESSFDSVKALYR